MKSLFTDLHKVNPFLGPAAGQIKRVMELNNQLQEFQGRHELLIEILCDAARFGPEADLESCYQKLREWMEENYPFIRCYVIAFLRFEVEDALGRFGAHDAFEALFAAPDLATFLEHDDKQMISRIERTQEAVQHYGAYLKAHGIQFV